MLCGVVSIPAAVSVVCPVPVAAVFVVAAVQVAVLALIGFERGQEYEGRNKEGETDMVLDNGM